MKRRLQWLKRILVMRRCWNMPQFSNQSSDWSNLALNSFQYFYLSNKISRIKVYQLVLKIRRWWTYIVYFSAILHVFFFPRWINCLIPVDHIRFCCYFENIFFHQIATTKFFRLYPWLCLTVLHETKKETFHIQYIYYLLLFNCTCGFHENIST